MRERARFATTLPVFCEVHAYFARHPIRRKVVVADFYENPILEFLPITMHDEKQALELLRNHEAKGYSMCDALSFVLVRRLRLQQVVSFDKHFRQFGEFNVIC